MFENLETLFALAQYGTVSRAAARLGLTQSAASKRLQALRDELGQDLVEPSGRGVALTPFALQFLERVRPGYMDIREALSQELSTAKGQLVIAISGALLVAWGPTVLKKVRQDNSDIRFSFSTHRSPIAIASVRSGEALCAIVHGSSELTPDLAAKQIVDETIVIVPAEEKPFPFPRKGTLKLLSVEAHSETWSVMERKLRRVSAKTKIEFETENSMQNFVGVTQLARAGFAHGLTPIGVPLALGVPKQKLVYFPHPGIRVPVSLVGRRSTLERPLLSRFYESLKKHVPDV